jgi:hypothetical protein
MCIGPTRKGGTMNRKLRQHLQDAPRGTLNALATHMGVRYQTIQKWVSGERPLSEEDYDRALVFLIGLNHINRQYQGSASTVVYPSRFNVLPPAPASTMANFPQLMKAFRLIKQELLRAAGAVPPDRHAILDYLHRA